MWTHPNAPKAAMLLHEIGCLTPCLLCLSCNISCERRLPRDATTPLCGALQLNSTYYTRVQGLHLVTALVMIGRSSKHVMYIRNHTDAFCFNNCSPMYRKWLYSHGNPNSARAIRWSCPYMALLQVAMRLPMRIRAVLTDFPPV